MPKKFELRFSMKELIGYDELGREIWRTHKKLEVDANSLQELLDVMKLEAAFLKPHDE